MSNTSTNNSNIKKSIDPRWKLYYELMAWYEKAGKYGASPSTRYHLLAEVNHQLNHCPIPEPGYGNIYSCEFNGDIYKPTTSHSPSNPFKRMGTIWNGPDNDVYRS